MIKGLLRLTSQAAKSNKYCRILDLYHLSSSLYRHLVGGLCYEGMLHLNTHNAVVNGPVVEHFFMVKELKRYHKNAAELSTKLQ